MSRLAAVIAAAILAASFCSMRAAPYAVASLLAELAKRRPAETQSEDLKRHEDVRIAAEQLRSIFDNHPKQKALYRSKHKRKATRKTRRAGATAGGVRELLARAIEIPGFRATVVHTTRIEARERAWTNDTNSGFIDVLRIYGAPVPGPGVDVYILGGIRVEVRDQESALEFANGARIELIGLDNLRAQRKKRGNAKHVIWIDEAQDFRFLDQFYKAVVIGSLNDFQGECWLSGTPGSDSSGLFYEATRDDEDRLPAWEVHEIAVVDNPYFGAITWEATGSGKGQWFVVDNLKQKHGPYATEAEADQAAIEIRWENTAGTHIRENNLREDDPDVQREWFAKWVKEDLRYVYPIHVVPKHVLLFAPQRLRDNPFVGSHSRFNGHPRWYDHEKAVDDLPRKPRGRPYQWLFAMGADFGYYPDPFAMVAWAFCRELPDVYEMFSWKHTRVLTDDQGVYLRTLWDCFPTALALVGDPAGKQDDFEEWRQRLALPMEEANKAGKNTLEEFLASAIRRGHVHLRDGSPLHQEMRHLTYLPTKPGKTREVDKHRRAADGIVYGDHCCDGGRYAYKFVDNYLWSEKPKKPTGEAAAKAEEQAYEDHVDRVESARKVLGADDDDDEWTTIETGHSW